MPLNQVFSGIINYNGNRHGIRNWKSRFKRAEDNYQAYPEKTDAFDQPLITDPEFQ